MRLETGSEGQQRVVCEAAGCGYVSVWRPAAEAVRMTPAVVIRHNRKHETAPVRRSGKRERAQREAPELGGMLRRMAAAMARRAASGDLDALVELLDVERAVAASIKAGARGAHDFGYSWTEVADAVGLTRQAARQRFMATTAPVLRCPFCRGIHDADSECASAPAVTA